MKKNHKQEIASTRVGGFGGSDASMFYRIGLNGLSAITNSDKKRIRVAKGIDEYKPIPENDAMRKGHEFEDWYASQPFAPIAEREAKISRDMARNFEVFAHADFAYNGEVFELKCVGDPDNAIQFYYTQLQWYYMLGMFTVWAVICDSNESFEDGCRMPEEIEANQQVIDILMAGVKLLDDNWNELDLETGYEWSESDLLPFERKAVEAVYDKLSQIKKLEADIEADREAIRQFMERNGVRSINSDLYSITYVSESESRTFDKKLLSKAHPELKLSDFEKVSKKKSYVTIKLKGE